MSITFNGKPLVNCEDDEILEALAEDTELQLTEAEQAQCDGATD